LRSSPTERRESLVEDGVLIACARLSAAAATRTDEAEDWMVRGEGGHVTDRVTGGAGPQGRRLNEAAPPATKSSSE
jgi:hypothetical protein